MARGVNPERDDDLGKQLRGAIDQVQVAVRRRIEATGVDRDLSAHCACVYTILFDFPQLPPGAAAAPGGGFAAGFAPPGAALGAAAGTVAPPAGAGTGAAAPGAVAG